MNAMITELRKNLLALNQAMARRLSMSAAPLAPPAGATGDDPLFLYGITGGKDVGKTTLINLLAGRTISEDSDFLDEGTRRPVIYCHAEEEGSVRARLGVMTGEPALWVTHRLELLRRVTLVDLPDFDSRYAAHREAVVRILPHLDGLVWVTTPRKYMDHEWTALFGLTARAGANCFLVLNKLDQIADQAAPDEVRTHFQHYIAMQCERLRIPPPPLEQFFLLSAQEPDLYDAQKLKHRLVRAHAADEIARAKTENLKLEFTRNIDTLRIHYALEKRLADIGQLRQDLHTTMQERFGGAYAAAISLKVAQLERLQQRIGFHWFNRRTDGWPILRLLRHPLAGFIGWLAGWFMSRGPTDRDQALEAADPLEWMRVNGLSVFARLIDIEEDLARRCPAAQASTQRMEIRQMAESAMRQLFGSYEAAVVTHLAANERPLRPIRHLVTGLPLIWFPLLQPLLVFALKKGALTGAWPPLGDALLFALSLLGASNLLGSMLFLLAGYTIGLLWLYARCAMDVRRRGTQEFSALWRSEFIDALAAALLTPVVELAADLRAFDEQLNAMGKEIVSMDMTVEAPLPHV